VHKISSIIRVVAQTFEDLHTRSDNSSNAAELLMLSERQMRDIMGVLYELIQNFFPMAHTNAPLQELRILNEKELNERLQEIDYITNQMQIRNQDMYNHAAHFIRELKNITNP
jgi:hypothetical protein